MSGFEAVAVFGIACNVMQTISFAHESISTLKQIRNDGLIDPKLHKTAENMRAMAKTLVETVKGGSQDDIELVKIASECSGIAEKLVAELDKLALGTRPGQQTAIKTIRLVIKKWWKKGSIEMLEKELNQVQEIMETRILVRSCKKNDAIALQQEASFKKLNEVLQNFIAKRSQNETELKALIMVEVDSIMNHTTSEHIKTRIRVEREHQNTRTEVIHQVSGRINDLQLAILAQEERSLLLKSFDFPKRGERICDIKEVKGKSFQWLFGDTPLPGVDDSHGFPKDTRAEKDEVYERLMEVCRCKTWHSFTSWLESDGDLYWITAKAGAGKSTLMKFLSDDPRTRQLLVNNGRQTYLIISHSFYLMGSQMQCDIKGLLCNVLYQILQADEHGLWTDELMRIKSELFRQNRASYIDWSVGNLQSVLCTLLKIVTESCQVCLFLDGLDEVHQVDGKHALLKMLKTLRTDFPLKMCVSSRPEAEFRQVLLLERCPVLELHTLTGGDMYQYALDLLTSVSEYLLDEDHYQIKHTKEWKKSLAYQIVQKANGVFLWADIATKSLQTAMTNGDTWLDVEHRLTIMPEELGKLFASMWNRLGSSKRLYRAEAALCFNLVLDWDDYTARTLYSCWYPEHEIPEHHNKLCNYTLNGSKGFTLFQLALAKRESFTEHLESWNFTLKIGSLRDNLVELYQKLPVLSAGLLEFSGPLWRTNHMGQKDADADVEIRFIHRTAKEFFTDSIEGQEILRFDTSRFELRFCASVRAILSRGLASQLSPSETKPFYFPAVKVDTCELAFNFRKIDARVEKKKRLREMAACQAYHDRGEGIFLGLSQPRDFLSVTIGSSSIEYVECFFNEPMSYTSEYKDYVIVTGISSMDWLFGLRSDWQARLKNINYLLSWGYKPESTVIYTNYPYMSTGLEAFLWGIWGAEYRGIFELDEQLCDSILETLQLFAKAGADFMQPMYGYYVAGFFFDGTVPIDYFPRYPRLRRILELGNTPILVEYPILGIMIQRIKVWEKSAKTSYMYQRLGEFLKTMNPDQRPVEPKIVAVGPSLRMYSEDTWVASAKCVPATRQKPLVDSFSKWIPWDDENWQSRIDDLQGDLREVIGSILDDDEIPKGIENHLLYECGLAKSWSKGIASLFKREYGTLDHRLQVPDGVVYPPVKYIDQTKSDQTSLEGKDNRGGVVRVDAHGIQLRQYNS